jgi:prepilin-type N-terminal cleavage/methylation domain-containing protein
MKKTNLRAAFTLIELLVVIGIIAVLAGIATPVYIAAQLNAQIMRSTANARQIGLALMMYANDNDGRFPKDRNDHNEDITTSNDAFRSLFPTYLTDESIFAVGRSKAGPLADNRISQPSDILARGENHWAYVAGSNTSSNSQWPLIVDHTDGSGFYTDKEGDFGGTWKGTKGIIIHTDISAAAVRLLGTGVKRYIPRFDDKAKNALELTDYMGDGAKLLEPAR